MDRSRIQTFTTNSGVDQSLPTVNINNTNNDHINMRLEDQFQMLQGMMSRMQSTFVFGRENQEGSQSRGVSEEFLENLPPMKADKDVDCNICLEKVGSNGN